VKNSRASRLALAALLLALAPFAPLPAQEDEGPPIEDSPPAEETPEVEAQATTERDQLDRIDEILEGEEEVFLDTGYTYDPGDRRDPFKSLLLAERAEGPTGPRPEGIPGLVIDELTLTGIFRTGQGYIAQVQPADKEKSFLLKAGDQLFDGDVVSVSRNEVVFKKIVNDPTRLKPFMEVVKKLNP
jgi:hypothetical protein